MAYPIFIRSGGNHYLIDHDSFMDVMANKGVFDGLPKVEIAPHNDWRAYSVGNWSLVFTWTAK